jgi:hypothetical protein
MSRAIPKKWHFAGRLHHYVTQFSDGDVELIICKYWSRRRQRWEYHTQEKSQTLYEIRIGSACV